VTDPDAVGERPGLLRLSNPVRPYSWGTTSAIADLLGIEDDGEPKAELWLGAHPDSPSTVPDGRRLDELVAGDATRLVGPDVEATFGARLPYLLKVLSAAEALSLQVHPNAEQAAAGFADEEARGVPRDAPERRYRDPFHKPEMIVALEPFDALCGLRDPAQTRALLGSLEVDDLAWAHLLALLSHEDSSTALRDAVGWLLGDDERIPPLVRAAGEAAAARTDRPEFVTTAELSKAYPGDPGVLVALLLNQVRLAAGEALFLPAGNIHAYLRGTGIEVMASSDNVLRAGLTPKHVDAAELMRITDFTPWPIPFVVPERSGPVATYRPGAAEFELAFVTPPPGDERWHDVPVSGPRILLVLDGELEVAVGTGAGESASRGTSLFIPAAAGSLSVRGAGTVVVAGVPPRAV
jgi:mannose-6-phosphate isomerase